MRICYLLLSPTFGMHQYTADLANRLATGATTPDAAARQEARRPPGLDVHLVTTSNYPADRYMPAITVHTPLTSYNTGLALSSLNGRRLRRVVQAVLDMEPDMVHFTGPHLWNVVLLRTLRRRGVPTVHTLHDLDPHSGARGGRLLHLWNGLVLRLADTILVHGQVYQQRLARCPWLQPKVTYLPLLHLFVSYGQGQTLPALAGPEAAPMESAAPGPSAPGLLFFGRLVRYKGVADLLTAYALLRGFFAADGWAEADIPPLILAGQGNLARLWPGSLPPGVTVLDRLIDDQEAIALFRRCRLLVLPYTDGTQSALIPAAYYFGKPVVVTRVGALAEYVLEDQTGFVVEPGHPASLARLLHRALSDPARLAQMGANGRLWYEQRRIQETAALYQLYRRYLPAWTPVESQWAWGASG